MNTGIEVFIVVYIQRIFISSKKGNMLITNKRQLNWKGSKYRKNRSTEECQKVSSLHEKG